MNTQNKSENVRLVLGTLMAVCMLAGFVYAGAWTDAPTNPPANNVAAPLNVGDNLQIKEGPLDVGGLLVQGKGAFSTSSYTLPTKVTLGINGAVAANAYCDLHGNNCTSLSGGDTATTTGLGDPDYESDWINVKAQQDGKIVHNLGTERFSMMQTIVRQNAGANNDEATFYGHDVCKVAYGQTVWGVYFVTNKDTNPLNELGYWVGYSGPCYHPSMVTGTAYGKRFGNWTTHAISSGQMKVRIWK